MSCLCANVHIVMFSVIVILLLSVLYLFEPHKRIFPRIQEKKIKLSECRQRWKEAMKQCPRTDQQYLIIGAGHIGSRLIRALLYRGETRIRVFDKVPREPWCSDPRVEFIQGDICSLRQVQSVCTNVDIVFLTAAAIRYMDELPHELPRSYQVNVVGTKNVVQACKVHRVEKLIYTSSIMASVSKTITSSTILTEDSPPIDSNASPSHYCWTKGMSESIVRGSGVNAVIIRPGSVYGPDDNVFLEPIIQTRKYQHIGRTLTIPYVYIDDLVYLELLAERFLKSGTLLSTGNGTSVSNHLIPQLARRYLGDVEVIHVPFLLIWCIATVHTAINRLVQPEKPLLPGIEPLTRATLRCTSMTIHCDDSKTRRLLKYYASLFSHAEAVQLAIAEKLRNGSVYDG